CFFFTVPAPPSIYTLSLHDALPIFTICTVDEEYLGQFGEKVHPEEAVPSARDGAFFWPTSVALDSQGNAYVADEWLNRISVFTKDRKSTRLNSSHVAISYAVFCLKK